LGLNFSTFKKEKKRKLSFFFIFNTGHEQFKPKLSKEFLIYTITAKDWDESITIISSILIMLKR
jgi:hypothetical protein